MLATGSARPGDITETDLSVAGFTVDVEARLEGDLMRGRGGIAGVLAVCGAVAMAGPARADQYDFIAQLDNMGVYYTSMVDMMGSGYTQPL